MLGISWERKRVRAVLIFFRRLPLWVRVIGSGLAMILMAFWLAARFWLPGFVKGLQAAARLLAEHVPHIEGQRVDLANAPRIRT